MKSMHELRKMDKEKLISKMREMELKLLEYKKRPSAFFIKRVRCKSPNGINITIPKDFKKVLNIGHYYKFYYEEVE